MAEIHLKSLVDEMLAAHIVVGPALNSVGIGGLDVQTFRLIEEEAKALTSRYWPESKTFRSSPNVSVLPITVQHGFIEMISSTAAYLSHLRLGYLQIDESMTRVAVRLIEKFIESHSFEDVMTLNFHVHAYDDLQVLKHYGRVLECQFVTGELHRPWIHYSLLSELDVLVTLGYAQILLENGESYVHITELGANHFEQLHQFLSDSGFLKQRTALIRFSQFSQFTDYDQLAEDIFSMNVGRLRLIELCGIQPGMEVLELGAGTGGLTYDAGLYKLVGPTGHVVVTEPSFGMLQRAQRKEEKFGIGNVRFIQSPAEELPFPDNSFDAVVGFSFLHFTDIPRVLKEVQRVLKPGGIFSTLVPMSPKYPPFIFEWLAPLLSLLPNTVRRDIAPSEDDVPNLMQGMFEDVFAAVEVFNSNWSEPQKVIRFGVEVGNAYEAALNQLPWKAKQDMLELLIERGKDIVAVNPADSIPQPAQFIRARVVKSRA